MTYPHTPGWKAVSTGGTAEAAARHMAPKAPTLRERVLALLESTPAIPETLLAHLRKEGVSTVLTSVRRRCSELARMGMICDSGRREPGEGGCMAIVWRVTTSDERALHHARQAVEREKAA